MERSIKNVVRTGEEPAQEIDRRRQILMAARRLFSQRGYHGVNVRTIAAEAGLKSPAHVYFYFENTRGTIQPRTTVAGS
jgi:AcrR family transcriptional regulator